MADKDDWGVVETRPATADDWGVAKKWPSDSSRAEPAPIVEVKAEPATEAERIAIEPAPPPAEAAPDRKRTSGENAIVGGTAGAIKGILEKYLMSTDRLQKEVYMRALKNTLLQSGIDLSKSKTKLL
jgi:hypothetical protein